MANIRQFQTPAWPGVMAAALCCLLSADAIALPPQIQLDARVRTAGDAVVKETIAPGAVLRSGDEVRIRVTARADGHLYVIALGSSGTAELLHPFVNAAGDSAQGGALPAPVGSGEVVAVPADGGYLPLDDRLGQEMIVAFVADQPVESLTRLMFRMEGLFDQPAAAREVLVSEGYELAHLSFSHAARAAAIATAPAATMPTPAPDVRKASVDDVSTASVPAVGREEGVLGGLGSRIAQFIGQPTKPLRDDPAAAPTAPSVVADTQSLSDTTPDDVAATQSGSLFSRWFGTDEKSADNDPAAVAAVPEPPKVQQARTFALPAQQQVTQKELPPQALSSAGPQPALEERPAQSATARAASVPTSRVSAIVAPEQAPATAAASSRVVKPLTADTKPALEERPAPPPAAQVPAPRASTYVALEEDSAPVVATGRMVDPLPVEATLYPAGKLPAEPRVTPQAVESDVPAGGRVQRTLSRLFDDESAVDSNKVKPGVAAPEAVSGETPVIADPALREEAERAEEPAARSNFGADADSLREETNRQSLVPVERGSESVADRQAVDVPADVVISRPADAAQQSGSWFSALGALFSTTKPNTPSDEEISSIAGASAESGQANAQDTAALGQDRTLIVQPVDTLTTDAQLEAREPAATIAEQASADQSEVVGESAVLSGLGRDLPAQTSPETDPVRSAGADVAREATKLPREQPEAAVPPSASQGGLLAGLSALLGSSAVGDEDGKTPQIQPASSTEQALAEEETASVPLAAQPGVESSEPVVLSAPDRNTSPEVSAEPSQIREAEHPASVVVKDVSARESSRESRDEETETNDVEGGLFAGLGSLFGGSEAGDDAAQTPALRAASPAELATVEDRAPSSRVPSVASSGVASFEPETSSLGSESSEARQDEELAKSGGNDGGLLAGLSTLLSSDTTGGGKSQASGSQQALTTEPEFEPVANRSPVAEQQSAEQLTVETGDSEVLSGLGRKLPPVTYAERLRGAEPAPVVAQPSAQPLLATQREVEAEPDGSGGGLLSGLGTLLAGKTSTANEAKTEMVQSDASITAPVRESSQRVESSARESGLSAPQVAATTDPQDENAPAPVDERSQLVALRNEASTSAGDAVQRLDALRPKSEEPAPVEERSLGGGARANNEVEMVEPKALGDASQSATIAQLDGREVSTVDDDSAQRVNAVTEPAPASAPATSADSGLLAGLGRLFRDSESSDSTENVAVPADGGDGSTRSSDGLEAADAQNAQDTESFENADSGQPEVEAAGEGGLLAGIGALLTNPFASSEPESPVAPEQQAQAPAQADSPDVANASAANTDDEPRIKRRVERNGKEVVVLDGLPAARAENKENLQVLGGAGSRIRRLLDEPEPKADSGPGAEVGQLGAAPLESPAGTTTTPAQTTSLARRPSMPLSTNAIEGPTEAQQSTSVTPIQQVASLTAAPAGAAVPRIEVPLALVDVNGEGGVASSVVLVITPAGNTSGVVIDRNGHLLTNWHSVNRFDEVVVMFKQARGSRPRLNEPVRARVVAHSKFADLALLKVEAVPAGVAPAVLVADVDMQSGAPIHAIGHAAGRGGNGQWRHDVASVDRVRRSSSWYSAQRVLHRADVIRAEMNPVHNVTGAPLFNNQLELVGLGAMVRVDKGEIVGVSAATIRAFLAAAG